jgi:uncharacterized protein YgbK (DUF1537 family)
MDRSWFILADDLTGAADSAIAFARRGVPAQVVWGNARPVDHSHPIVLAYDAATRELDSAHAARRHTEVLQRFAHPRMHLFKKIDSTLRGHPAEEIAAMLDVVRAHEPTTRVVLAASFPAAGRTVHAGEVRVHGVPLTMTEYWPEGRASALANLVKLLASGGLLARSVELATVRGDSGALASALAAADPGGRSVVAICDAESDNDLQRIAEASLAGESRSFFIGSAGFAHALAQVVSRAGTPRTAPHRCEPSARGALVVVGSHSRASRTALLQVSTLMRAQRVSVDASLLAGDLESSAQVAITQAIRDDLAAGIDVVVDLAPSAVSRDPGNPRLVSALASLIAPAASEASALVATGGETAAALLARLGAHGIRLLAEIEPGIPLGLTLGEVSVPVVTKAGGFGDEDCLKRIIERLRSIRQTGNVA